MKKIYTNIILPIILSIFGSILYAKFIDPNFDSTVVTIGNFFAKYSNSYLDYIYENIGDGIKEIFSYYTYAVTFGLFFVFNIFVIFHISIRSIVKRIDSKNKRVNFGNLSKMFDIKIFRAANIILAVVILFYFVSSIIKHHYTYNAIIYIEKSLDIIAPKINEQERLELRAQYRTINSYEKFNNFNKKIIDLSKQTRTPIPVFKLIVK